MYITDTAPPGSGIHALGRLISQWEEENIYHDGIIDAISIYTEVYIHRIFSLSQSCD
jgi:hypothetical protein